MTESDNDHVAQTERHLNELDARIAQQRQIVARLAAADDKRHTSIASDLLRALEDSRRLTLYHLRRQRQQLKRAETAAQGE